MAVSTPWTDNTIILKGTGRYEEYIASGAGKPGHLLQMDSDGKVLKHNQFGGRWSRLIAVERGMIGETIIDAWAIGDRVFCRYMEPGAEVQARLAAGAAAVDEGDLLISAGDGTVQKAAVYNNRVLYQNTADSAAIASTASETDFDKTYSLPANSLRVGDVITIRGQLSSVGVTATPTLQVKVYIGATAVLTTAAVTTAANDLPTFEVKIVVRAIGASGSIVAYGTSIMGVPGTGVPKPFNMAATSIDTTAAKTIKVSATWSASSASNTVKLSNLTISKEGTSVSGYVDLLVCSQATDNSGGSDEIFVPAIVL